MKRTRHPTASSVPLRERAEAELQPKADRFEQFSAEQIRELAHELSVHQIELEMQNEELRGAQRLLEESHDRYADLYDFAPVGYLALDAKGIVRECNLTAAEALGVERSNALNNPLARFVDPADQDIYFHYWRGMASGGQPNTCELRLRRGSHESFCVELRSEPVHDSADLLIGHRVIVLDISERRAAEERYRVFVDHAADAFFLHGPRGKVLDVNRQACASLGYERQELIGMLPADFDPDATAEGGRQIEARLLAGETVSFDSRHRRKDGSVFPVEVRIRPFRSNGQLFAMALARDISERKLAEQILRESEERLRAWMEASAQIYWTVGADGKVDEDSASWRAFTGQSYDQFRGDGWLDAIHPADRERTQKRWCQAQITQAPLNFEYRLWHTPSGQWRWVNDRGVCVRNTDGSTRSWVGMCIDIHERKLADKGLASSRDRYAELYDFAPIGYLTLDGYGVLRDFNQTAAKALGLQRKAALGRTFAEFVAPEDREAFDAYWMHVAIDEDTRTCELRLQRPDESHLYVELRSAAVRNRENQVSEYRVVLSDISERKQIERERDLLQERLYNSQKLEAVGIVAAGVAHDFNNTLAAVMGSAELMQDDLDNRKAMTGHIRTIRTAAESANLLVSRLLHFTRERSPAKRPTSLNELLENQRILYEHILGRRIELVMKLRADAPLVLADSSELVQLVLNLIVNAKDAMENGGKVEVKTTCVRMNARTRSRTNGAAPSLKLVVSDSGSGMSPETAKRAFEPFYTTKQPGRGTGLGLAVVSRIVEGMQGSITVKSASGQGTSFEILLPAFGREEQQAPTDPQSGAPGSPGTILLVDDNELVRSTTAQLLTGKGYSVLQAASGAEALACIQRRSGEIALLLTDVIMEEMGGPELARIVQRDYPSVKILFFTGYGSGALQEADLADYPVLSKPVVRVDLIAAVQSSMAEKRNAAAAVASNRPQ